MDWALTNRSRTIASQERHRPYRLKRLLDIVLCIAAFPVALPIMILCALLIRMDSPGPAFFIQERIGKNARRFKIYKFRTMHHNLDDSKHRAFMRAFVSGQIGGGETASAATSDTAGNDTPPTKNFWQKMISKLSAGPRFSHGEIFKPFDSSQITRVGRILRKTSLDELPQLWNVLKGDMSIVGPRPNVPWEVAEYVGDHYKRLDVLPGVTGLAQVRGRSSLSFNAIVENDLEYIEKQSLLMDLKILWWTVTTAVTGKGAG
ncbi:MAG: sugar transferase [Anaerolineae bacterium]|nr:sugar transferase [Anaerolineae bacterium]